jgi:hypothetical protein
MLWTEVDEEEKVETKLHKQKRLAFTAHLASLVHGTLGVLGRLSDAKSGK